MIGSGHTCAPMAILFKIIADFYDMPCRMVVGPGHALNMALDANYNWNIVDVAQLNFNGKKLLRRMPWSAHQGEDIWNFYDEIKGNKAMSIRCLTEEVRIVQSSPRRMIPFVNPQRDPVNILQVLAELEYYLLVHYMEEYEFVHHNTEKHAVSLRNGLTIRCQGHCIQSRLDIRIILERSMIRCLHKASSRMDFMKWLLSGLERKNFVDSSSVVTNAIYTAKAIEQKLKT